jgi:Flp pilus assembly protein TadD
MRFGKPRPREVALATGGLALALAGAALILPAPRRSAPTLDGLGPLIAARRFDEADRRIRDHLRAHPESLQAHLLMAQVALGRDEPRPQLALEHLDRIQTGERGIRSMVWLNRGKAYSALGRNDQAERAWKEALRLDPTAPEVGWDLLGLYYVQGRRSDAHRLALELHAIEPDPRDRVQLLLELVRQDAQPLGPESLIRTLEPIVRAHSEDRYTAMAMGLALVRNSRADEGLIFLHDLVDRFPDDADARLALLLGLDESRLMDELTETLARLPPDLSHDPRLERFRGAVAQERHDWAAAADAYLRAGGPIQPISRCSIVSAEHCVPPGAWTRPAGSTWPCARRRKLESRSCPCTRRRMP